MRLYNSNGVAVRDGAVGNDGTFSFTNLEPGIYRVEYVSAPDGYSIETFEQTVEVTTTTGAVATLYASRHSSIIIHKLDGDTKPSDNVIEDVGNVSHGVAVYVVGVNHNSGLSLVGESGSGGLVVLHSDGLHGGCRHIAGGSELLMNGILTRIQDLRDGGTRAPVQQQWCCSP